jgi:putative serine protease PepD
MEIAESLIQNGSTVRPGIGVTIVTYLEATAQINTPGVYIYSVSEGGPAEAAGIMKGDRLISLNGLEMTQDEFVMAIRATHVGDVITLRVERNGETMDIDVIVGDMNQIHK